MRSSRAGAALWLWAALLAAPPAHASDPFGPGAQMQITLLAEDVAHARSGKARRELEGDLRAAYEEYALARAALQADHPVALARLDHLADDPALAGPVTSARAARYPPESPYAAGGQSHYLGLRTFYADDPATWGRVLATFDRAYRGP